MDEKTLRAILACIHGAKDVIQCLAIGNWPDRVSEDNDINEMFYQLNDIALKLYEKIHELEGENNDQRES